MSERFNIEKQISKRRSANAFLAFDNSNDTYVRLRRIHSGLSPEQLRKIKDAFAVTRRQLALIKSDLILPISDSGIDGEGAWISLPYHDNQQLLNAHTLPITLPEFHNLATQLFTALSAIHNENLVHGALNINSLDVIPAETQNGRDSYHIRDLGMRRLLLLVQNPHAIQSLPSDYAILAPELFQNEEAEPSSDLYMAGQILYYLLAGGHPLVGLDEEDALQKHLKHEIPLVHKANANVPEDVSLWLDKLIQASPNDRPRSAQAALDSLPHIDLGFQNQPDVLANQQSNDASAQSAEAKPLKKRFNPVQLLVTFVALAIVIYLVVTDHSTDSAEVIEPDNSVTIEIKAATSGSVSGASLTVSNQFLLGSSPQTAQPWGTSKSRAAKGKDLGSSYRAFVTFKVADIIDADDHDVFANVSSLENLKLELQVTAENDADFIPLLYVTKPFEHPSRKNIPSAALSAGTEIDGFNGEKSDNTFTYLIPKANFIKSSYSGDLIFILTAPRKTLNGENLVLNPSSVTLKITK